MRLSFSYLQRSRFSQPVTDHSFTLKVIPRDDAKQRISGVQYSVSPACRLCSGLGPFRSNELYGTIREAHSLMEVSVQGRAEIFPEEPLGATERYIPLFALQSRQTKPGECVLSLLSETKAYPDVLDAAWSFTETIQRRFRYKKGVTGISTTAEEAMRRGAGVCQDYSQILLSLLRLSGFPARYVCGMVLGDGESHAWVELFSDGFWIAFDPTRARLADTGYIKISVGRDSFDTKLNKGIYKGVSEEEFTASFSVIEQ